MPLALIVGPQMWPMLRNDCWGDAFKTDFMGCQGRVHVGVRRLQPPLKKLLLCENISENNN